MAAQGSAPPRETRLALVMNGGVSLAVWMGGVSAEIDRLRLAGREAAGDDEVLGLWEELVTALNVRVTVDVVAGTSAGGLNGAALATSIARGTRLPDLRQTWLEVASIGRLAGNENQENGERPSVLNGEMFAFQIEHVFEGIGGLADPPPPDPPDLSDASMQALAEALEAEASLPRAVVLFTTATSLHGKPTTYADVTRTKFGQLEYRLVCEFRRGVTGADAFARPEATKQLARAARASASFPAAFAPAFFSADGLGAGAGPLNEGPDMDGVAQLGHRSRWVIDGGVLDNEPFGPILDEISRRPINADVDRVVAYVVPEGGLVQTDSDDYHKKPGMIGPVLAALSLPREVNLANQLDRLRQMERDVRATRDDDQELFECASHPRFDAVVEQLFVQYRAWRLAGAVWEARTIGAEIRDATVQMLSAPDEAGTDDAGQSAHAWLPTFKNDLRLDTPWRWGPSAAERVLRLVMSLERRKARDHPRDTAVSRALVALSAAVDRMQQLRRDAHDLLKKRIAAEGGAAPSDRRILEILDAHYASDEERQIETAIVETLRFALDRLSGDRGADVFAAAALKVEVVRRSTAGTEPYRPTPRFRFYRFGANSGSPLVDGGTPPKDKLLGLRVGHFGGFLDRSWRAYDWTWGRMDGATQLIGMLVNPRSLRARFEPDPDARFGDADADRALEALRENWSDADALDRLRTVLVTRFHRAILAAEVETILTTMGDLAPKVEGDAETRFKAIVGAIPTVTVEDLRKGEGGQDTISRLVAAALVALSDDPKLPLRSHLSRPLRGAANAELGYDHVRRALHRFIHGGD